MDKGYDCQVTQSHLANTDESIQVLSAYDKFYHTNKRKVQKGKKIIVLRNCALCKLERNYQCVSLLSPTDQ